MKWRIIVDKSAKKQVKRLPKDDFQRIQSVIDEMSEGPFAGDVQKVKGEINTWRRRTGNYRIFYIVYFREKLVYIFEVKRRTSTTYS